MINQQQQYNNKPLKVGLISCANRQTLNPAPAKDFYAVSPLFRYSYQYCQNNYDQIYLVTGNLKLISPDQIVTSDDDVNPSCVIGKKFKVLIQELNQQIEDLIPKGSEIYLLTDKRVARVTTLTQNKYFYHLPLKSLGIGQRLKWLKSQI